MERVNELRKTVANKQIETNRSVARRAELEDQVAKESKNVKKQCDFLERQRKLEGSDA